MSSESCDALVIGGGPAGLRAAEIVSVAGWRTIVADQKASVGRKFLVAGRGGLNLTHSESLDTFLPRYGPPVERWNSLLEGFSPNDLREWAAGLGIETFVGTSGRIFPTTKQSAPLLRRWVERLRDQKVTFRLRHHLSGFAQLPEGGWMIDFATSGGTSTIHARAVVLTMGGGSWPQTGSDGAWTALLEKTGVPVNPLAAANVGFEVDWPADFLPAAEGLPLKNIVVRAEDQRVAGELLITKYGIEGGAVYQLGRALRSMKRPRLEIDLKPTFSMEALAAKVTTAPFSGTLIERAARCWRLSPVAQALLELHPAANSIEALAKLAKTVPVALRGPRPMAEAISSSGGIPWEALDESLMLRKLPGLFCAGEMIDWEAPTGGYLLQGCFSTGTRAAQGARAFLENK